MPLDTGTGGSSGAYAWLQGDGNLVVYSAAGVALWSSSTAPASNARLVMQDDGNLVLYSGSVALWSSVGAHTTLPPTGTGGYPDADAADCSGVFGPWSWCKGGAWQSGRGFAYRNCTDYVAWKRGMVWAQINSRGSGHAVNWKQGWIDRGREWGTTPRVGAVAWWGSSVGKGYGHVAYVTAVNPDGTAIVSEYNGEGQGSFRSGRVVRAEAYLY